MHPGRNVSKALLSLINTALKPGRERRSLLLSAASFAGETCPSGSEYDEKIPGALFGATEIFPDLLNDRGFLYVLIAIHHGDLQRTLKSFPSLNRSTFTKHGVGFVGRKGTVADSIIDMVRFAEDEDLEHIGRFAAEVLGDFPAREAQNIADQLAKMGLPLNIYPARIAA